MHLMICVTRHLGELFAGLHRAEADHAVEVLDVFLLEGRVNGASQLRGLPSDVALPRVLLSLSLFALSQGLSAREVKTAVVLKLVAADGMVSKVVQSAELKVDEIEGNDAVLEKLISRVIASLVAAAGQQRVQNEDWHASDDENRMLKQEDD